MRLTREARAEEAARNLRAACQELILESAQPIQLIAMIMQARNVLGRAAALLSLQFTTERLMRTFVDARPLAERERRTVERYGTAIPDDISELDGET